MKRIRNNNGSSLIEILISMVIISITAMGSIALYFNSAELKTMSVHKKFVTEMASSKLEELRDKGYAHSDLDIGVTTSDVDVGGIDADVADGNGMTVTVTDSGSGYKQVQVDIDWEEAGQIDRNFNVSLITYVRP